MTAVLKHSLPVTYELLVESLLGRLENVCSTLVKDTGVRLIFIIHVRTQGSLARPNESFYHYLMITISHVPSVRCSSEGIKPPPATNLVRDGFSRHGSHRSWKCCSSALSNIIIYMAKTILCERV